MYVDNFLLSERGCFPLTDDRFAALQDVDGGVVGGDNDNPLKLGLQEKLEACETLEIDSFFGSS